MRPFRYLPPIHAEALFRNAKKSALQRGIEFTLTVDDVREMLARARGRCEVSGVELSDQTIPGVARRPWIPSLDRIRSNEGYALSNCRITAAAVNLALNEWGQEVLLTIACAMAEREQRDELLHTLWQGRTEESELGNAIEVDNIYPQSAIVEMFRVKGAPSWFVQAVESGALVPAFEKLNYQTRGRGSRANHYRTSFYRIRDVVEVLDSLGKSYQSRLLSMKKEDAKHFLREASSIERDIQSLRKKRATLLAKAMHIAEPQIPTTTKREGIVEP